MATDSTKNDFNSGATNVRSALLLIDSDPLLRWCIERHLGRWFEVASAGSAAGASQLLRERTFDALVTDGESEDQLTEVERQVRRRNENVRIVRLTTGTGRPHGECPVICVDKPFRLEALSRALGVEKEGAGG